MNYRLCVILLLGWSSVTCAAPGDDTKLVRVWNFDQDTQGWIALHDCKLTVSAGVLRIQGTGRDPYLAVKVDGPPGWKELTIRARFRGRRNPQLFWMTRDEPNPAEDRSTGLRMRSQSSEWKEYKFYFKPRSRLTELRLDPHNGRVRLDIDWMRLRNRPPPAESATDPAGLELLAGFRVELLHSVPPYEQGSWVSMAVDPKGRLIACDQYGGLYRVTPPPLAQPPAADQPNGEQRLKIEPITVAISGAQGLLWAFDSLYVVVNSPAAQGPGLYRVRDTDGDDQLDQVELLRKLEPRSAGVEHGPHGVVLGPDGKSLYIVAGNMTRLPEDIVQPARHTNWAEDLLLPRGPASNGHATGIMAPGGWICRTDPDGRQWELISAGFRNPYDIAWNLDGELFTFDADMEMDVGTPWYHATRVCHVVSGAEFGWRYGTGKWPDYYPDSLPAVVDVGLGSPTGVAFGYGANFPQTYQEALFICDWTHGKMYAVHLKPAGASYTGTLEEFITGMPLPLTDVVINPVDGAMYFTIGGRRTQSGLYRVTHLAGASSQPSASTAELLGQGPEVDSTDHRARQARALRHQLEAYHGKKDPAAIDFAWPHLESNDRHLRYAARVAIEHQKPSLWIERALKEMQPDASITALLAMVRLCGTGDGPDPLGWEPPGSEIIERLGNLDWKELTDRQRADLLRVVALTFIRMGKPDPDAAATLAKELAEHYPAGNKDADHELCRVLVYLGSTSVVETSLELMRKTVTQEDRLFYLMALSHATSGWSLGARRSYFEAINQAETAAALGDYAGGGHLQIYVRNFREDAAGHLTDNQMQDLNDVLNSAIGSLLPVGSPTPRKFVRNWQIEDLLPEVDRIGEGRSHERGKEMFTVANCIQCHRFNNVGGILGPDITDAAKRYSRPVLLREILQPSQVISDQFQTHVIVTTSGKIHEGRILGQNEESITMATDPTRPAYVVEIPVVETQEKTPSKISMMPKDLLNTLTKEEILDLLAYIESGGDPNYGALDH